MINRLEHAEDVTELREILSIGETTGGLFSSQIDTEGYTPEVWGKILGSVIKHSAMAFDVTTPDGRRLEVYEVAALIFRGMRESVIIDVDPEPDN